MIRLIFIITPIITSLIFAQANIDSLRSLVDEKDGIELVDIYNQISLNLEFPDQEKLEFAEKALELAKNIDYLKGQAEAKNSIGSYYYNSDQDLAIQVRKEALKIAENIENKSLETLFLENIGLTYLKKKDFENAKHYLKRSVALTQQLPSEKFFFDPANNLGLLYWRTSKYDSAIHYYQIARKFAEEYNDKRRIGIMYNNIGIIYWQWNLYDKALESYLQSLKIRKERGDSAGVARLMNNIGLTYQTIKSYDKAEKNYREALRMSRAIGNDEFIGYSYLNLGHLFLEKNELDKAESAYRKSIEFYRKDNVESGELLINIQLGRIKNKVGQPDSALQYLHKAIRIGHELNNIKRIAMAQLEAGISHRALGNFKAALSMFDKALKNSNQIEKMDIVRDVYKEFSNTYKELKKYNKSIGYFEKYHALYDSLNNADIERKIVEYQTQYETEKALREVKEKDYELERSSILLYAAVTMIFVLLVFVAVLVIINRARKAAIKELNKINRTIQKQHDEINRKNDELGRKNIKLERAFSELNAQKNELDILNAAKDKLFSLMAHDIKNPLGAIIGYAEIAKDEADSSGNEDLKEITGSIHSSASHLADLLENILTWSRDQQGLLSLNKEQLLLSDVIDEAIAPLISWKRDKSISLELKTDRTTVTADKFMLSTILRNLVHNSVKFTPSGGKIKIEAVELGNATTISVTDTGKGMSREVSEKLLSSSGNEIKAEGTGLGLRMTRDFINRHKGSITVMSEPGIGTTFTLVFPKFS